jgi:hypothetical protein
MNGIGDDKIIDDGVEGDGIIDTDEEDEGDSDDDDDNDDDANICKEAALQSSTNCCIHGDGSIKQQTTSGP